MSNSIFPQMMTTIEMMMTRMEAWVGGNSNVGAGARWIVGWRLHCDVGASSVSPQLAQRGGGSHTMGVTQLALTGDRQTLSPLRQTLQFSYL